MKLNFLIAFVLLNLNLFSQQINFADHLKKTAIAKLQSGDSLVYYQCHVDSASQEITTSNGKKIKTKGIIATKKNNSKDPFRFENIPAA